ncbi:hypothetical protein ED860_18645, partial [Acinetobacter baumannii]
WRIALLLIISWRKQSTGYATLFSPHTPQMTIALQSAFFPKVRTFFINKMYKYKFVLISKSYLVKITYLFL